MSKHQGSKRSASAKDKRSPLYASIKADSQVVSKKASKTKKGDEDMEMDEAFLSKGLSQKLLKQVREQQLEEGAIQFKNPSLPHLSDESSEEDPEENEEAYEVQDIVIDESDAAALSLFMNPGGKKILKLGEALMAKIQEKEATVSNLGQAIESTLDPKVIQVYTQIGQLLHRYKAGKLPRAVKIIPLLNNWEEILFLTQPDNWSPQATGAVTKVFASNFNEKMAQRYFSLVLLPAIRNDIRNHKKLNFHLYLAVKKTLYKPNAFFKGVLIPLCEAMDCSLREAIIIGSIIAKSSIPVIPSSVALMKLCTMQYSGTNSLFIRILIDKKYALPYRVLDALVAHFLQFRSERRPLPVIWHQALLSFAQRYKEELTADQKKNLKFLLREKTHHQITPEIQRELFNTKCRGEDVDTEMRG